MATDSDSAAAATALVDHHNVPLSNGVTIPAVGFGCAFGNWTGATEHQGFLPEEAWRAVTVAYEAGVRHFDTAHLYGTERHIGSILGGYFAKGELKRSDVFLTTKIAHPSAPSHIAISGRYGFNPRDVPDITARVNDDYELSLDRLGVGYTDLCLMHWPGAFRETDEEFARKARAEIWTTQESFLAKGSARAIGVCNFNKKHLETLMEDTKVKPMVNQIEVHPYCQPRELLEFCKANDIVVEAYAPFASGAFGLLKDPVIVAISEKTGKNVGQVILRWHLQQGRVVLPKSTNPGRIAGNLDIHDFELSDEDMAAITALGDDKMERTCPSPEDIV